MVSSTSRQIGRNWSLPEHADLCAASRRCRWSPGSCSGRASPGRAGRRWRSSSPRRITDFFDGYLARAWSQQSSLGRMLDPIADKLLVAAAMLMLAADQTISGASLWAAIVILCREILVSGLREYLAELRVSVPVSTVAKWKTAANSSRSAS